MFDLTRYPNITVLPRFVSGCVDYQPSLCALGLGVALVRPRRVVEIGVFRGDSLMYLAQSCQEGDIKAEIFGIDWFKGDSGIGTYDGTEILSGLTDYVRRIGYPIRLLPMRGEEARPMFKNASIDLLHIDACHEYEAVKNDFETWLPAMSDRGVVMFHDTHFSMGHMPQIEVWKYWQELRGQYPSFEFPHACGVGLVVVGSEAKQALELCAVEGQARTLIQSFMQKLGQATVDFCTTATAYQEGTTAWTPPLGSLSPGEGRSSVGSPATLRPGMFSGDTSSDEAGLSVFERILTQGDTTATSGSISRTDGKESASDQKT